MWFEFLGPAHAQLPWFVWRGEDSENEKNESMSYGLAMVEVEMKNEQDERLPQYHMTLPSRAAQVNVYVYDELL